jgi:hypothetical protein
LVTIHDSSTTNVFIYNMLPTPIAHPLLEEEANPQPPVVEGPPLAMVDVVEGSRPPVALVVEGLPLVVEVLPSVVERPPPPVVDVVERPPPPMAPVVEGLPPVVDVVEGPPLLVAPVVGLPPPVAPVVGPPPPVAPVVEGPPPLMASVVEGPPPPMVDMVERPTPHVADVVEGPPVVVDVVAALDPPPMVERDPPPGVEEGGGGALNPPLVEEERGRAIDPLPEKVAFVVEEEANPLRPRTRHNELYARLFSSFREHGNWVAVKEAISCMLQMSNKSQATDPEIFGDKMVNLLVEVGV